MRKVLENIRAVTGRVIFIGLCVQALFGLLWMCGNLNGFQEFGESYLYLQAGDSLRCDEYMGILYPLFLRLGAILTTPFPGLRFPFVYLCQLAAACFGGYRLLRVINGADKRGNLWGMFALLGVPAAMQCHMAVLPCSFASSALLLELSCFAGMIRYKEKAAENLIGLGAFYFVGVLLLPDHLLLGALPLLFGVLYGILLGLRSKDKRLGGQIAGGLCVIVLCLAGAVILPLMTRTAGSYGRARRTPALMAASRFAGSCLEFTYGYWPEDLKDCLTDEEIRQSCHYPADVWQVFGKAAQERLGPERADEVFRQVAEAGYQVYYAQVRHDLFWDLAAYGFSPLFLQLQLQDRGYPSYTGRNYDIMRQRQPVLTKRYVDYGSWWFAAGLLFTGLWQAIGLIQGLCMKKKPCPGRIFLCVCCAATGCVTVLWYTFQGAGMMDYKNTAPVILLWTVWMAAAARGVTFRRDLD